MSGVYYNEIEPYCVMWLFNLMQAKLIPYGDVDQRPIQEITPYDVEGYTQCHFFAGIAGWAYALRLAGWPDDCPVWTGSCPCQPFSVAGKHKGFADVRDLWPHWFRLIRECHPSSCLGEQVASAADWLARMRSDLEAVGYAVGCLPIQAACAGAAQYRDRYWFVAQREYAGRPCSGATTGSEAAADNAGRSSEAGVVAHHDLQRQSGSGLQRGGQLGGAGGAAGDLAGAVAEQSQQSQREPQHTLRSHPWEGARTYGSGVGSGCDAGIMAGRRQPGLPLPQRQALLGQGREQEGGAAPQSGQPSETDGVVCPPLDGWGEGWTKPEFRRWGFSAAVASLPDGPFAGTQFIECPGHKWRRLPPPGVCWLGDGIPARVAKLRALGNAIYPPLAAEVIKAYMECRP
jgi:DNA (cytosine-5)-methyltransferase 1